MIDWGLYLGVGLLLGIAMGYALAKFTASDRKRQIELERQVDLAREEMESYKALVADHFVTTSGLVNNLTDSYRAVHEHLSVGAKKLCGEMVAPYHLDLPESNSKLEDKDGTSPPVLNVPNTVAESAVDDQVLDQPPKDYPTESR